MARRCHNILKKQACTHLHDICTGTNLLYYRLLRILCRCADYPKKTRLRVNGLNILFCLLASVIIVALLPKGCLIQKKIRNAFSALRTNHIVFLYRISYSISCSQLILQLPRLAAPPVSGTGSYEARTYRSGNSYVLQDLQQVLLGYPGRVYGPRKANSHGL